MSTLYIPSVCGDDVPLKRHLDIVGYRFQIGQCLEQFE